MRTRQACMQKRQAELRGMGLLFDFSIATIENWVECLVALRKKGMTYQEISWFFGGLTYQGIQHDFHVLGLDNTVKRGGDHSSKVYVVDGQKRTIAQHCARRGLKYPGVYSKMRKLMDQDASLSRLDALISALGTVKVRQFKSRQKQKQAEVENAPVDMRGFGSKLAYIRKKLREREMLRDMAELLAGDDCATPETLPEWY
jgi:hypothetical protein